MTAPRQRPPIPFPSKEATVSHAHALVDSAEDTRQPVPGGRRQRVRNALPPARRAHLLARVPDAWVAPRTARTCLQEIFLQVYRKLGSFKGDAAIGTWLYRLALNHCLDYVRSRQARMNKLTETLDAESSFEPIARRDTPIARLDLERALERLPDGCREAFVLHDVEGFDHKEVGRLLGIAEGTSKSQVFKARMKLRTLLNARK